MRVVRTCNNHYNRHMADPSTYRPRTSDIPTSPGVYRFIDDEGRIIYVGKAKNLRNRLTSYFQDIAALHPRTQKMVTTAAAVKWVVVNSDIEALTLEYSWIKEFSPRFNVMYRDDKSYPYLAVSLGATYPRMYITRESKNRKNRYFGPYTHVWAIRETMDMLQKVFPVRTCSQGVFNRAKRSDRPCLLGYIDRCAAPCVGRISVEDHKQLADDLCQFMAGHTGKFINDLTEQMQQASANLEFEKAAKLRDRIDALHTVMEKNAVVLDDATDTDVFALACDDLVAAVHVFHVRAGRIRGERGWVIDRVDDAPPSTLMAQLLQQVYSEATTHDRSAARSVDDREHLSSQALPPEILVSHMPDDATTIHQWLEDLRQTKVSLRIPMRGAKKALMETVTKNAEHSLQLHKNKRMGDLTQRSQALEEIQEYCGLENAPLRIECYDISHTAGRQQMASMVVFEDALPRKKDYRTFSIKENEDGAPDDTAAMSEVLQRRFRNLAREEEKIKAGGEVASGALIDEETGRPKRFSYRPDLVVVDGGLPQVNAAQAALDEVNANVPVIGLAKRLEEIWVSGSSFPIIMPRTSAGLFLLQYLRDESHRFAIKAHRNKRGKAVTASVLDRIDGLGDYRQKQLLTHFGSVKKIKEASIDQLTDVPGIGASTARDIYNFFHSDD